MGFRVEGLGFRVEGLGFRVEGLGFRAEGLGSWVFQDLGCRVLGVVSTFLDIPTTHVMAYITLRFEATGCDDTHLRDRGICFVNLMP